VPVGLVVFLVVVGVPVYGLWILGIRYAAEKRGAVGADGPVTTSLSIVTAWCS
jgi:hypothetical protein